MAGKRRRKAAGLYEPEGVFHPWFRCRCLEWVAIINADEAAVAFVCLTTKGMVPGTVSSQLPAGAVFWSKSCAL